MGILKAFSKILRPSVKKEGADRSAPPDPRDIRAVFSGCADFAQREIKAGELTAFVFFIDGLTGGETVAREIIKPLSEGRLLSGATAKTAPERKHSANDDHRRFFMNDPPVIVLKTELYGKFNSAPVFLQPRAPGCFMKNAKA